MQAVDYYPLAKLAAEAKHRSADHLLIYDIRIFGYYSRLIDPDGGFLLSEFTRCARDRTVFRTSPADFVRDYIGAKDLASLIRHLIAKRPANQALDSYSAEPVGKLELLKVLAREFGMPYEFTTADEPRPAEKPDHPTCCRRGEALGWRPTLTSLDLVVEEMRALLAR
jgi:nucleoside-diphosphate-sugar epimerase